MSASRPLVLIGPYESDPTESVSQVNRAFVHGLGDRYRFVPHATDRCHGTTRRARLNLLNGWYFFKHLVLWIWRLTIYRPQVVHYAINAGWAMEKSLWFLRLARWSGARTVGHLHSGSFPDFWKGLSPHRRQWAERQIRQLDGVILLSNSWLKWARENWPLPPSRLFVVNNPLDRAFEDQALAMPVERSGNVVLAIGVMDRLKGLMEMLEAARLLRNRVPFVLQLAGPEREPGILAEAQKFVAEHQLADHVRFRPGVWGEEKLRMFKTSAVFLLPSYYENFPLVVLEAAAAGLPIVATPVGATPEFFQDRVSALFVPVKDSAAIAKKLEELLSNPTLRHDLGNAARTVFLKRLRRETTMESLDHVYCVLLGRKALPKESLASAA